MEEELKTFFIPNELCRRAGVAASWSPINKFAVFAYEKRNVHQQDAPSNFASKNPSSIFLVRQDVLLFQPIFRKFVNESNRSFLDLQNIIGEKTANKNNELLRISRQYRSVVRACLEDLHADISKAEQAERETLQDYITIFYSVECIWHLCEILFIESIPGNVVLPFLLEWIRFHFPKHERNAANMLAGDLAGLEQNIEFWPTVFGSLLQGRVKVVRALLKQHSASDSHVYRLVDQVLRAMPIYDIFSGTSINEFQLQWKHWTVDVQTKIDAKMFVSDKNLDTIMKLVVGEEQAWAEIQVHCETWYELLAAWLFYTEPTVKTFELGQFAKHCITKMNMRNRMKHLDRVLLAAIEFDELQVIKEIQQMSENGWFVTHLTDILYHADRLNDVGKELENFSSEKLRESFLLDYGTMLMGHKSLWQVGLDYLDRCPNDGPGAIELLLPRIPLEDEAKTRKVLREAKIRKLDHVAQSICKVQGVKSLRRGRLGNALSWALKSQDGPFTSYLADKFLQEYTKNGKLASTDFLDNLGSCMMASDRLIFLGKYYEFHKLYQAAEYKEAGNLLISLLASKIIPNYFWYVLLVEAIPLLESEEIVFSSNNTLQIIHCLEDKEDLPELKDKIDILRLAAARNLSRALTYEAQFV
ncbi:nuclear pore complex protein Nup85 [Aethina tumida]|uniref:nuclear pore complex protein Nup85 n=1 Tax=Aethina tumida TaxID=116153 RepID=UPI002148DAA8|nr:nuclear pore complex protein Nup85 [Aethina tumida]